MQAAIVLAGSGSVPARREEQAQHAMPRVRLCCSASGHDLLFHPRRILANGQKLRAVRTLEVDMKARVKLDTVPEAMVAMRGLQEYVNNSGLDHRLLELVKLRASQINGCAFCMAMHAADARKLGEHEMRLHLLSAWREAQIYTARERAALAWTEAVTELRDGDVPDAVYETARAQFPEAELVALTYAIVAINGWNRLCISFRVPPTVPRELVQQE